jgi:hypothetical protein
MSQPLQLPCYDNGGYFTLKGYRNILLRAISLDYKIVSFRNFSMPADRPLLLLRHDLDHPLRGAELFGQLEADVGVTSTFFVQATCDFYNLLSKESRRIIRVLAALGHEIGLHYVAERYLGVDAKQTLVGDLRLLEDLSGHPIISASQHIPIDSNRVAFSNFISNDACEARFTEHPMHYISDSLMVWRQAKPHDLLDKRASFQFLSHPDTWMSRYRSMDEALNSMMEEEISTIRVRYAEITDYYRTLLRERRERDEHFRKCRSEASKQIL